MNLVHTTYELTTPLRPHEAMDRIARRLADSNAHFQSLGTSIVSAHVPLVPLWFQFDWRRRRNIFGRSDFADISSLDVSCDAAPGGGTNVTAHINRTRALGFFAYNLAFCALVTFVIAPPDGLIVATLLGIGGWFIIVELRGGYRVRKAIRDSLATVQPVALSSLSTK